MYQAPAALPECAVAATGICAPVFVQFISNLVGPRLLMFCQAFDCIAFIVKTI